MYLKQVLTEKQIWLCYFHIIGFFFLIETLFKKEFIQTTPMAFLYKQVLEQITIMSYSATTLTVRLNWGRLTDFLGLFSGHVFLSDTLGHSLRTSNEVFNTTGIWNYPDAHFGIDDTSNVTHSLVLRIQRQSKDSSRKNFAECATKSKI